MKKIICIGLALLSAATLLVSCGSETTSKKSTTKSGNSASKTTTKVEEKKDYGKDISDSEFIDLFKIYVHTDDAAEKALKCLNGTNTHYEYPYYEDAVLNYDSIKGDIERSENYANGLTDLDAMFVVKATVRVVCSDGSYYESYGLRFKAHLSGSDGKIYINDVLYGAK